MLLCPSHLSRTSKAWRKRVLLFTDSMVTMGALMKGRSSARALLRQCRVSAVIQMMCRIRLYLRWVPSEKNYADGPSRAGPVGVDEDTEKAHTARGLPRRMRRWFHLLRPSRARPVHL